MGGGRGRELQWFVRTLQRGRCQDTLQTAEDLLQSKAFTSQPELPLQRGDSPLMGKVLLLLALRRKRPFLQLHVAFFKNLASLYIPRVIQWMMRFIFNPKSQQINKNHTVIILLHDKRCKNSLPTPPPIKRLITGFPLVKYFCCKALTENMSKCKESGFMIMWILLSKSPATPTPLHSFSS